MKWARSTNEIAYFNVRPGILCTGTSNKSQPVAGYCRVVGVFLLCSQQLEVLQKPAGCLQHCSSPMKIKSVTNKQNTPWCPPQVAHQSLSYVLTCLLGLNFLKTTRTEHIKETKNNPVLYLLHGLLRENVFTYTCMRHAFCCLFGFCSYSIKAYVSVWPVS